MKNTFFKIVTQIIEDSTLLSILSYFFSFRGKVLVGILIGIMNFFCWYTENVYENIEYTSGIFKIWASETICKK